MTALKAQRSLPWAMAASFFERFAPALALLIMAPIIGVQQTGVASLSMALIFILALPFKGFSEALTQESEVDQRKTSALFYLALISALLFCALLWLGSGAIASLYELPQLASLIPLHSLVVLGMAIGVVHDGLFQRNFEFHRQAKRKAAGGLIGLAVGLFFAFWRADASALVVYHLTTVWASTIIGWLMSPIRMEKRPDWAMLRMLLPKTLLLASSQLIGQINQRGIDLIVGLALGVSQVAIMRMALQVFNLITAVVVTPIANVLLSYFSSLQRDVPDNSEQGLEPQAEFVRVQALTVQFVVPAFIYAGLVMPYAFEVILGAEWLQAGIVGRIVSVNGIAVMFSILASTFLISIGRLSKHFAISLFQAALTVTTTAIFAPFGLIVLAWVYVARGIIATMFTLRILEKNSDIRLDDLAKATFGPILCTVAGASAFLMFEASVHTISQMLILAGATTTALSAHALIAALFFGKEIKNSFAILRAQLKSRKNARKP